MDANQAMELANILIQDPRLRLSVGNKELGYSVNTHEWTVSKVLLNSQRVPDEVTIDPIFAFNQLLKK